MKFPQRELQAKKRLLFIQANSHLSKEAIAEKLGITPIGVYGIARKNNITLAPTLRPTSVLNPAKQKAIELIKEQPSIKLSVVAGRTGLTKESLRYLFRKNGIDYGVTTNTNSSRYKRKQSARPPATIFNVHEKWCWLLG